MGDWVQGLILGAVQGLTEWLPISSDGVLTLIQLQFFDSQFNAAISYSLWLHLGTLIAAVLYFRRDVIHILKSLPKWLFSRHELDSNDKKLLDFLFFATLITGIVGVPLLLISLGVEWSGQILTVLIGVMLIGTGLFQKFGSALGQLNREHLRWSDGVLLGVAQGLSTLPGLSRSGLTVTTFLLRGFEDTEAIKLSFLMSIPVIFGAEILLQLLNESGQTTTPSTTLAVVGVVAAAVVGWLTIAGLVGLARRVPFWIFAIFLGVVSLTAIFF